MDGPNPQEPTDRTMEWITAEAKALIPLIEQAKRGTTHEACDGWSLRDGTALCSCGAPLDEILEQP